MKRTLLLTASLLILFASACKTDDPQLLSAGTADFSHYVAIGNSLSSGFTNQELTRDGQAYSYPMQISEKMALAGGGTFKQPYMTDNIGFGRRLTFDFAKGYPVSAKESLNPANLVNIAKDGPFNNMSVPGAKVLDLNSPNFSLEDLDLSKGGNPYYSRFAKIPGTSTIMQEVLAQKPTFFTLWIGNNDVLGYGLRGGDLTIGAGITPTATYLGEMKNILDQLAGTK
jgi:hypothetical protein